MRDKEDSIRDVHTELVMLVRYKKECSSVTDSFGRSQIEVIFNDSLLCK